MNALPGYVLKMSIIAVNVHQYTVFSRYNI